MSMLAELWKTKAQTAFLTCVGRAVHQLLCTLNSPRSLEWLMLFSKAASWREEPVSLPT